MQPLFVIGMPGSGKSTIGKLLANKLSLKFFDLDEAIVEKEKRSIPEIFEKEGEAYFRQVESEILKEITHKSGPFVLATGGGAPCFHNGMDWMHAHGTTVFIDVNPEVLLERIATQEERPLLKEDPAGRIQRLFEERLDTYQQAQVRIKADGLVAEEVVDRIIKLLKP